MSELVESNGVFRRKSNRGQFGRHIRTAGYALIVFLAYYLGAKVGFALTFKPHPVSTLWPPNAILLAFLLLTPRRMWKVVLLAAFPAHLIVELQSGVPIGMVLCWFVSNSSEALIGAVCIRYFIEG
ncbi:MAG: MASE1 domain-containing protein, partial [Acidobacteria bacterium]|nr:MASE1 domain-containing protein [Acidobacteriota bacterium]